MSTMLGWEKDDQNTEYDAEDIILLSHLGSNM